MSRTESGILPWSGSPHLSNSREVRSPRTFRRRPRVEPLESRRVLALLFPETFRVEPSVIVQGPIFDGEPALTE
jgi:hypothetical protein